MVSSPGGPPATVNGATELDAWDSSSRAKGWTIVRSLKRYLEDAGPDTIVEAGNTRAPLWPSC